MCQRRIPAGVGALFRLRCGERLAFHLADGRRPQHGGRRPAPPPRTCAGAGRERRLRALAGDEILRRERMERLRSAVASLSGAEKNLFYRKYYYMQSTAQIAAELGLSERGVEGRLYRLRGRLRKLMGGDEL